MLCRSPSRQAELRLPKPWPLVEPGGPAEIGDRAVGGPLARLPSQAAPQCKSDQRPSSSRSSESRARSPKHSQLSRRAHGRRTEGGTAGSNVLLFAAAPSAREASPICQCHNHPMSGSRRGANFGCWRISPGHAAGLPASIRARIAAREVNQAGIDDPELRREAPHAPPSGPSAFPWTPASRDRAMIWT